MIWKERNKQDWNYDCFTEVMATSMVAVTIPALAVPLSVGRGPGAPIVKFINQATIFFFVRKQITEHIGVNFHNFNF